MTYRDLRTFTLVAAFLLALLLAVWADGADAGETVDCDEACVRWVTATLQREWFEAAAHRDPFLVCTRAHESSPTPPLHDDGYGAVSPSGRYRGAYQFSRSTWDATAVDRGWPHLVGVDPAAASVVQQDFMALHLYRWQGSAPWLGRCA